MTRNTPLPTRRPRSAAAPGDRSPGPGGPLPDHPPSHADVLLEPGNLVAVGDELGAQMLAVVDGEVMFTARSISGERRWRGRLGARGLMAI